eukprot:scaffold179176_cov35-Tisochrysis_lutea.AAC.5
MKNSFGGQALSTPGRHDRGGAVLIRDEIDDAERKRVEQRTLPLEWEGRAGSSAVHWTTQQHTPSRCRGGRERSDERREARES